MKVVFVCTGNTCRSPMAEAILKDFRPDIEVKSRGLSAAYGDTIADKTLEVLRLNGITNFDPNRRAVKIKEEDLEDSLVLTMDENHRDYLKILSNNKNIFTLREYAKLREINVKDPYGQGLEEYKRTFREIEEAIKKAFNKK